MDADTELLRRFADDGAQDAFAELVRRRIDLVYAAALRQTGGDTHLAQDVTQGVFLALACQAAALRRHAVLTGWLYTTTRFLAAKAVRTQARWQRREQEANTMNAMMHDPDPAWEQLRPMIDEAMHELGEKDRAALLLRYFENRSLADVGAAIGLAENSARMRVERALEKLRERLARRGITSTVVALSATLAAQPVVTAPAGLAASAASVAGAALAGVALGGAGATSGVASVLAFMSTTKLAAVAAALFAAGALGGYWAARPAAVAHRVADNRPTSPAVAASTKAAVPTGDTSTATPAIGPTGGASLAAGAASAKPSALDTLRVLTDLRRRQLVSMAVVFVNPDNRNQLSAQFGELFNLNVEERAALQQMFDHARNRVAELELANATVSRDEKGNVVIAINPFPEAGGQVYDEMMKSFEQILGAERNAAFLALYAELRVEHALHQFGAAQRTVKFLRETTLQGQYTESENYTTPTGGGSSNTYFKSFEDLMSRGSIAVRLLPPDFGGGK